MTLIIRRSPEIGSTELLREPFPEPGVQPKHRISALAFQGIEGDSVPQVVSPEDGAVVTQGTGDVPVYRIGSDGKPAIDFDSPVGGEEKPTLAYGGVAGAVKTQIVVARVLRLPSAAQGLGASSFGQLLRSSTNTAGSIFIGSSTDSFPHQLGAYSGSGAIARGPVVSVNEIHFMAATYNGSGQSILQLDGEQLTVDTGVGTGVQIVAGFNPGSGLRVQIFEAAQYTTVLTKAQLEEKRAHYRALYQF